MSKTSVNRLLWMAMLALAAHLGAQTEPRASEIVIYDFEGNPDGWAIPDWARGQPDYVAKEARVSTAMAQEGSSALELAVDFPNGHWAGAYVERQVEVQDWTSFGGISVSVYLPGDAPKRLKARIILTVGEDWKWTEMNRGIDLMPDQWTTITANLKPGSMDWKFFPDESFRKDIRKIGIRIESDGGAAYSGAVFVDNVRLAE